MTWVKPPDTTPHLKPRRLRVRTVVRAPGVSASGRRPRRGTTRESLEGRDPAVQRLREVDLAAHRGLGDLADLGLAPGVRREHLDDLALDQGGVDVEHDEALGALRDADPLHRDVDPARCEAPTSAWRSAASEGGEEPGVEMRSSSPVTG